MMPYDREPRPMSPETENALLRKDVRELTERIQSLEKSVAGLVEAWNTASGVVKFVKWMASIATAIGILIAAFKGFGRH